MAKYDKTIESLKKRPIKADIRWDDLVSLLNYLGFVQLNGNGSRRKFYQKDRDLLIICHQPHPSPCIDKGCVKDVSEKLIDCGLI